MTIHALRPWTDLVKLYPDVEAGALTEAVFAIDLGAIAACLRAGTHRQAGDPNGPDNKKQSLGRANACH